jgi:uncharacterized protein YndB with AHSA1/START domain
MKRVFVERDLAAPADRVYAYLAEHENLNVITPLTVSRICDGQDGDRNGLGSRRKLSIKGLLPFEETIVEAEPGRLIRYRITQGSPLRDHTGAITLTDLGSRTRVRWEITFRPVVPGLGGPLAFGLRHAIVRALPLVERAAA